MKWINAYADASWKWSFLVIRFDGHLVLLGVASDEVEIKRIENVIAKNSEEFVSFDLVFRCDPCIAKGRSARNDDGEEDEDNGGDADRDGGEASRNDGDHLHDDCECAKIQKVSFKVLYRCLDWLFGSFIFFSNFLLFFWYKILHVF